MSGHSNLYLYFKKSEDDRNEFIKLSPFLCAVSFKLFSFKVYFHLEFMYHKIAFCFPHSLLSFLATVFLLIISSVYEHQIILCIYCNSSQHLPKPLKFYSTLHQYPTPKLHSLLMTIKHSWTAEK